MNSLAKARGIATRFPNRRPAHVLLRSLLSTKRNEDEWNDAWEAAWLPDDLSGRTRAPWETDVNFPSPSPSASSSVSQEVEVASAGPDAETKAFVEEMNENWEERRKGSGKEGELYSLETIKSDYRVRKQRAHAGLWLREIEKMQEQQVEDQGASLDSDIDRLLHSCSDIFDTANDDLDDSKIPSSSEFKNKPEGWETTSKAQDGSIWEMTQREEDILLQEFDRRMAYCKFQFPADCKFYQESYIQPEATH